MTIGTAIVAGACEGKEGKADKADKADKAGKGSKGNWQRTCSSALLGLWSAMCHCPGDDQ